MFGMTDTKRAAINALLATYNRLNAEFDALCHAPRAADLCDRMRAKQDETAAVAAQIRALDPHGVVTG